MGGVQSGGTHTLGEALWVHERQRQKCYRIKELSTDYSSTKFLERFCKTRAVMKGGRGEDELRHELITLHDNKEAERGPDF